MKIAVIGAGASGLAAALQAAWNGVNVTLFEHNDTIGRKLTVTGSGHCNLTNDSVDAASYACADPKWMSTLLSRLGVSELLEMLAKIGIPARKTEDGWYYPLSNSAHSVIQAFAYAAGQAGITLLTGRHVSGIAVNKNNGFAIRFSQGEKEFKADFDRVIVSTGGCAYPSLGSRGDLFPVLQKMGHDVLENRPALAPILVDTGSLKPLQGMRFDVKTALRKGGTMIAETSGNLIFTEWGLNGPAVMDISHHVTRHPAGTLELSMDFLAFFRDEFNRFLVANRNESMTAAIFLNAFFAPKVVSTFLRAARVEGETTLSRMDNQSLDDLIDLLQNSRFPVKGVRDFTYCQVSAGGVPVTEVDPDTLESRQIKGLYLTGETLDVVGPCGGFNLHFAFGSGALAGMAAARRRV